MTQLTDYTIRVHGSNNDQIEQMMFDHLNNSQAHIFTRRLSCCTPTKDQLLRLATDLGARIVSCTRYVGIIGDTFSIAVSDFLMTESARTQDSLTDIQVHAQHEHMHLVS